MAYKDPEKEKAYDLAYGRAYQKAHPEERRRNSRAYHARHKDDPDYKEKTREKSRKRREDHPDLIMLVAARKRAKKNGEEFTIDASDIQIPKVCPVFGIPLMIGHIQKYDSPTLDRIDPTKGYVKGNVWVISWRANKIKSDAILEELDRIVFAIEHYNPNAIGKQELQGKFGTPLVFSGEVTNRNRKWTTENPECYLLSHARNRASKKSLEFAIEERDIQIPKLCPILGIPLVKSSGKASNNSPTLDRIDPSKGYIKGNIWVISWRANRIKNDATLEELKIIVSALKQRIL